MRVQLFCACRILEVQVFRGHQRSLPAVLAARSRRRSSSGSTGATEANGSVSRHGGQGSQTG